MTYPGGKNNAGVFHTIINQIPPHGVYIEPFLGSGAILRLKRPAALNIGFDRAKGAVEAVRSSITENGVAAAPPGKAMAKMAVRAIGPAARPPTTKTACDLVAPPKPSRSPETPPKVVVESSTEYRIFRANALTWLPRYPFTGDEMVYCDPPYMHETRGPWRPYEYELSDRDHEELLCILLNLPARVMISGYWSKLYARRLKGWRTVQYQAINRARKMTDEWLWMNYPEPVELHDYSYLGEGYRERERINKRKRRWVARLNRMDVLESQALLSAIRDAGLGL